MGKLGKLIRKQAEPTGETEHTEIEQNDEGAEACEPEAKSRRTSKIVLIALAAALCFATLRCIPMAGIAYPSVRLNEIMSSSTACSNADGLFCDYIELYNDSNTDVDISGYQLSDNTRSRRRCRLRNVLRIKNRIICILYFAQFHPVLTTNANHYIFSHGGFRY